MPDLRLTIQYVGTAYKGWQIQPGLPTVQGVLEDRLAVLMRRPVRVQGAARTDAGVHALGQVASLSVEGEVDLRRLGRSLNSLLPGDVAVVDLREAPPGFHARHSASGRVYRYRIALGSHLSPFCRGFAAHCRGPLDVAAMRQAAAMIPGERDFSSFRAAGDRSETAVKTVRRSELVEERACQPMIVYEVEATSFLQHMVRNIAGTLIEVGRGRIAPERVPGILEARDRRLAGPTAPAEGLFLVKVQYPHLA